MSKSDAYLLFLRENQICRICVKGVNYAEMSYLKQNCFFPRFILLGLVYFKTNIEYSESRIKITGYCYHLVDVINFGPAQSGHIKRLLLCFNYFFTKP